MNPKVDWFFEKDSPWKEGYAKLRKLLLDCALSEELKWGVPCYTFDDHNVVLIHGFKNYCALLFHKGVLLDDSENILIQQTKHVQAARQIRFADENEIDELKKSITTYIHEAIEIEKSGMKVPMKKTMEFDVPDEFKEALEIDTKLKKAYDALTPGRKRAYLIYFSRAKQSQTRKSRIEKSISKIMLGKGYNE